MWSTDSRDRARESFQEWCELYDHMTGLRFVGRQNDVAEFRITLEDEQYNGRDLVKAINADWRPPLRVITLKPVYPPEVKLEILLAEIDND